MRAMRVHEFGDPEVLVPDEVEAPRPGPTEVLVRVFGAFLLGSAWRLWRG